VSFIRKALRFKTTSLLFALSFILVASGTVWVYVALRGIRGPLILHFSNLFGIDQIGALWDLLKMGMLGIVIVLVNFVIALELEEQDWFLGKLLAGATVFLGLLIFIGFAAIISVN